MPDLRNRNTLLLVTILHVLLGASGHYVSGVPGYFYLLITCFFIFDIIRNRDQNYRAGFYALYIMGFEIVYRISGANIAWEAGKYFSVVVLLAGLIAGKRKDFPWVFVLLGMLLIPSIFLSSDPEPGRTRELIMFNFTGPFLLVLSGTYFMGRKSQWADFVNGFRLAFLPAVSLVVLISLNSGLGDLEFNSIVSNERAAGGFGANQVSTLLGWFLLLAFLFRIEGVRLTPFVWGDWGMIAILLIRGLVTMSRGGMMAAAISLLVGITVLLFGEKSFRLKTRKMTPYILVALLFLGGLIWYTNRLTNNFLLYRYQGLSTEEVMTGRTGNDSGYLTGREDIMAGDIAAFMQHPVFGVGYGMAASWHAMFYGMDEPAAHTEYTRLLSENGLLGVIFLFIAFIFLPVMHYFRNPSVRIRYLFLVLLLVSMLTMFHAAMRLALPGVLYGAAFLSVNRKF
jgi:hypothetical protein